MVLLAADPAAYFVGLGSLLAAVVGLAAFVVGQRRQWRTIGAEQKNADTKAWEALTGANTKEIGRLEGRVEALDKLWRECEDNKRELIQKYGAVLERAERDREDLRKLEREHEALGKAHDQLGKQVDAQEARQKRKRGSG